jgi:hypothetical protein
MSLDSRSPTLLGTNVDVPSIDVKVKFSLIQLARGFAQLATIGHNWPHLCLALLCLKGQAHLFHHTVSLVSPEIS